MKTSIAKDIIALIESQLNDCIEGYELQIQQLRIENETLSQKVLTLTNTINDLSQENNELRRAIGGFKEVEKENLIKLNQPKDVNGYLNQLSRIEQNGYISHSFDTLNVLGTYGADCYNKESLEVLIKCLKSLFTHRYKDAISIVNAYKAALLLMKKLSHFKEIKIFLRTYTKYISDRVLETKEPNIIIELASAYFCYGTNDKLLNYLDRILDKWNFIDSSIEKHDFVRLLWFAFYLSKDKQLLKILKASASFLSHSDSDIMLYHLCTNIRKNMSSANLKKIDFYRQEVKYLDITEKDKIFKSLDKRLKKIESKMHNDLSNKYSDGEVKRIPSKGLRKIWYVTKLNNNHPSLPDTEKKLIEEWIQLKVFTDSFLRNEEGYTLVKVLSDNSVGKTYVTSELLEEIRSKVGKKWVDVRGYQGVDKAEKRLGRNEVEKNIFAWPSTDLSGKTYVVLDDEDSKLNEESDLRKLGYQITGNTREKRWRVLEVAVKQLGLRKVAYTIAQNVKLRKGQKNGEQKFRYAIGEWEYDLGKLKSHYYRSNFTWPSTKIK